MYHLPLYYVQLRCLNIYRSKKQNGGEFPRLFFWLDLGLSTSPGMRLATLILYDDITKIHPIQIKYLICFVNIINKCYVNIIKVSV